MLGTRGHKCVLMTQGEAKVYQCVVMVTSIDSGLQECYDGNRGRLKSTRVCDSLRFRLRVTRAAMIATVNVTITQQIILYLLDQYYLDIMSLSCRKTNLKYYW